MVGVNPEFAHETMSGLSFHHGVAQALWSGKLFHIDLNAQRIGRFDQDFRFGSRGDQRGVLPRAPAGDVGLRGMRHFDAHPYRTEGPDGVWDFARGCIRTYLILKEKAQRFEADPDIKAALAVGPESPTSRRRPPSATVHAEALRTYVKGLDETALGQAHYGHEQLDQLVTELLLGVR